MEEQKKKAGKVTRREFLHLTGAGVAGMTLAGLPKFSYAQKPKYGGRVRIACRYAASGLDVHRNMDYADYKWYSLMSEGLTEQGPLPQVYQHPCLAKSWEVSQEGRVFLFPLKEGVKFHDGKDFTSEDVKYSFDRVMDPKTRSPRAFALKWVDSVNMVDKYTIKVTLKEPYAPFLSNLTPECVPIIPKDARPTGIKPAPGTGPFVFKEFVPNETIELTRFDKYHQIDERTGAQLPLADAVFIKKIVDETVRLTALRAGDMDFIETPPLNLIANELKKPTPGITVNYDLPGNNMVFFNVTKPPFDDKRVRHAVAYATDKQELLKGGLWGLGQTLNNQPFPSNSRFYIPVEDREHNIAKAKALLAEAGYPKGFKVELLEYSDTPVLSCSQVFLQQLRRAGIEGTVRIVDRAPYFRALRTGDYSITWGTMSERLDWDDAYYLYFHSSEVGQNNWTRYSNKELDKLLEQGRSTWKTEDRKPVYEKVIKILMEDLPMLVTLDSVVGYGFRHNLKGFVQGFGTRYAFFEGGVKYWWIEK
jgi:peptide/nickel transport system substrate-binding protein